MLWPLRLLIALNLQIFIVAWGPCTFGRGTALGMRVAPLLASRYCSDYSAALHIKSNFDYTILHPLATVALARRLYFHFDSTTLRGELGVLRWYSFSAYIY
jgi:hypothetical protein